MTLQRFLRICIAVVLPLLAACGQVNPPMNPADAAPEKSFGNLVLAPGFKVSLYARVPDARQMVLSPSGTLFVGNRDKGAVYAVLDANKDGKGDKVVKIADGLKSPNGVEFKDGSLYVAEISRVLRYDKIEEQLKSPPKPVIVSKAFPSDGLHGWKYIRFGPDGMLYVPVGAPCNVCEKSDPRYASITRMKPDGTEFEVFASGIRNTVGFDWDPKSNQLWFTDNGRDWLGDDGPPDELNCAFKKGMHFGFPYCHGKGISDPEFGKKRSCSDFVPAEFELGPHVAALGMKFYRGKMLPNFQGDIIYAEHGSWNRSVKSGYRVMRVKMRGGKPLSAEPLLSGFVNAKGDVSGRPVDVVEMPDGSLLISDDFAGAIYRLTFDAPPP